jgi:hypothetical protein
MGTERVRVEVGAGGAPSAPYVMPAKAGIQSRSLKVWITACAGMTKRAPHGPA